MQQRFLAAYSLLFVLVLVSGCASPQKGRSGDDWGRMEAVWEPSEDLAGEARNELPALTDEATLEDYLVYAALNNPGLRSAFYRWRAALEKVPQVRALPDPRLNYAYYIQEVETRVGPQRQSIGLTQMFPWFGRLDLQGNVALETARAEEQRFESARLSLFYRVKKAYYEYYYLARSIAVAEENVQLLRYLESVARTRYKGGANVHASVIKAQVELGKLEDRLLSLYDYRNPLLAELNAALDRPPRAPLPWPREIAAEALAASEEQLLLWLKESSPDLRALGHRMAAEEAAVRLARKNYYPDLTLGLDVIDTRDAVMPNVDDSGKDPVIARLSVNLPIWHAKYRAAEREAESRYQAAREEKNSRESGLLAELEHALYGYRDAGRKIDLYRDTLVPKAEQSFNVTQQAFAAERASFLDVVDAQRVLLEFQLAYERAQADRAQRLAELEMLVGRQITSPEAKETEPQE